MSQLSFGAIGVDFGATRIFNDITFTVEPGDRWGIVGRNGTGKTTLFRLLTGELEPTRGQLAREPGLRVSLLEQHRDFGDAVTVWRAAAGGLGDLLELEQSLADQAAKLAEDSSEAALSRYGRDLERFERAGGYALTSRVDAVLHGLGFDPANARVTAVSALSGGERGRLGLARQLLAEADILLLDEPTNHLDLDTTEWLEEYLKGVDKTVMLVSHDRAFLAAVVNHVLHFEGGSAFPYACDYRAFVMQREERRLAQQRAFDQQQKVIAHQQDYIARNIAGQNSRQAKGRRTRLARLPRLSSPISAEDAMALRFEVTGRGGDQVIVADDVTVGVPGRILLDRFSGTVQRGDVLGLIGANGTGKSTLLKSLFGDHPLDGGELKIGSSISAAYYRQDLSQVPLDKTLFDCIHDLRPQWERRTVQGHLGRFGFSGDEVKRIAGTLSGGERARVALAILTLTQANLLVLDEPTNHLDVESIEALEDAIDAYDGTVLLVSHDRELLRGLTSRTWILQDRHITEFDGGFAEWEEVSRERAHAARVRAQEEEALGRVHERQRVARATRAPANAGEDVKKKLKKAQRALEQAETEVAELEAKVGRLTKTLEDAALYTRPGGVEEASKLGRDLETLKQKLESALERWTRASGDVESLSSG